MPLWPLLSTVECHKTHPSNFAFPTAKLLHVSVGTDWRSSPDRWKHCTSVTPCMSGVSFFAFSKPDPTSALDHYIFLRLDEPRFV